MASLQPRRFLLWPKDNLTGRARPAAYAEGVMFTDGSIAVRWAGVIPITVFYPASGGLDAVLSGFGFGGGADIEWIDPPPRADPPPRHGV